MQTMLMQSLASAAAESCPSWLRMLLLPRLGCGAAGALLSCKNSDPYPERQQLAYCSFSLAHVSQHLSAQWQQLLSQHQ